MRILIWLFLLGLCHSIQSLLMEPCKKIGKVMNCTGKNLTDCPKFSKTITNLILDNNFINNFTTRNCQKWNKLAFLSIRNNQLKEINLNNFNALENIDLSRNCLNNIMLGSSELKTLIVKSNNLTNSFNQLIKDLHLSPFLNILDVSNNQILKLPIEFLTLKTNSLLTLNFSGNKLSDIDFSIFNKRNLSIDFSNNNISKFQEANENNIFELNISNNQLTKINGEQMNNFNNLKSIDFSNNPLNCFCNESKSFIQWIIKHKSLVVNSENTFCKTPKNQSIFQVTCPDPSTISSTNHPPPTNSTSSKSTISTNMSTSKFTTNLSSTKNNSSTYTILSSTKNNSSTYTILSSTKNNFSTDTRKSSTRSTVPPKKKVAAWKIILSVIIPLAGVLAIFACYFWFCRHKNKYQRLSENR